MSDLISKKKISKKSVSIEVIMDQIDRLKQEIERIQFGYKIYQQQRRLTLGPLFITHRQNSLNQLKALDRLYNSSQATKNVQREISSEIDEIYSYLEEHFLLTEDEIQALKTLIRFHTGKEIHKESLPEEIHEQPEEQSSKQTSFKSNNDKSIKSIYKELMKFYHPDLNNNPAAAEYSKSITLYYQEGDLEQLLKLYQRTFFTQNELFGEEENLIIKLEEELELLQIQYDEMVKSLGSDQNMTEKSALKRVKSEAKQLRNYNQYQLQLINEIYTDCELFNQYRKQKAQLNH